MKKTLLSICLCSCSPSTDSETSTEESGSSEETSTTAGEASTGETPPEETSTTLPPSTSTTGESYDCLYNEDCSETEICNSFGLCDDALNYEYSTRIFALTGVTCDDGFGASEVFWNFYRGQQITYSSDVEACPLSWSNEEARYTPTNQDTEIEFLEGDGVLGDDLLFTFCFAERLWTDPGVHAS